MSARRQLSEITDSNVNDQATNNERIQHVTPRPWMAGMYAALAVAFAVIGFLLRPWGLLLVWPAASLFVIAAAYLWLGPGVFRKRDGRLGFMTRIALGPYLLGGWMTLPHYRRRGTPWVEITPSLTLGRRLSAGEAGEQIERGVTAVLDLTSECAAPAPFRGIAYRNVPILDLTVPTPRQFAEAVAFIREHAEGGEFYLHCKLGRSRSAAVAAAYLIAEGMAGSAREAVEMVRALRPEITVSDAAVEALEQYAAEAARVASSKNQEPNKFQ